MISIYFQGWFQCRLATNPDPTDEPRGASGYTFALAGEPDLDRVIRLHDPVAPRSHGPAIGVFVTAVETDGVRASEHALIGARFDLLDRPKFESRNLLLTDDRAGTGLIHPFHLRCSSDAIHIEREDILYPPDPERSIHLLPPDILNRRAPVHRDGFRIDPIAVRNATGIADPAAYRARRKRRLEEDLSRTDDAVLRAALETRIHELSANDARDQRLLMMQAVQLRRFDVGGPATLRDENGELGEEVDLLQEWPVVLWMGAWDADALSGYLSGALHLPSAASASG